MISQRLAGKVALVTGAGSCVGAEHAILFAMHGAKVLLCDVQEEAARAVADEIHAAGGIASFCYLEVSDESSWLNAISRVVDEFSALSTLVNAAAVEFGAYNSNADQKGVAALVAANQDGARLGMQAALPFLSRSGNASIVNISPVQAAFYSPSAFAREISKSTLNQITNSVAAKYARFGVRANTIHPGVIRTSALASDFDRRRPELVLPAGRAGFPEEIAYCSLFLCSDEASYITAAEIRVDGGAAAMRSDTDADHMALRPIGRAV